MYREPKGLMELFQDVARRYEPKHCSCSCHETRRVLPAMVVEKYTHTAHKHGCSCCGEQSGKTLAELCRDQDDCCRCCFTPEDAGPTLKDGRSRTIADALDRLRGSLPDPGGIDYPEVANGPVEVVLAFNNDEFIKLDGPDKGPHFTSHGILTDLHHNAVPGSKVETTFPVDPSKFPDATEFPPVQVSPFDVPPVNNAHTTGHGYSKQAYFFNGGADSLVTVGPSLPKIRKLANGGAQFWVASIGVVAQGTGKYEGARGTSVYIGSAYLEKWPDTFPEQVVILRAGFKALVGTYFKLVLKKDQA
jgi:hypothetical protein